MAAWLVSQEEWQLTRKVRIVMAVVVAAIAGAILVISVRHSGGLVHLEDLIVPSMFLGMALAVSVARSPRVAVLGFAAVMITATVITYAVGKYNWRDTISTGIVILMILLIYWVKRGRERRQ